MKALGAVVAAAAVLAAAPAVSAPVDGERTVSRSRVLLGDVVDVPEALAGIDPDALSPREALAALYHLKSLLP